MEPQLALVIWQLDRPNVLQNDKVYMGLISLGIDPGWKNLGYAIVESTDIPFRVHVHQTGMMNFSESDVPPEWMVDTFLDGVVNEQFLNFINIERYVAYAGVNSSETENITMLIGMLRTKFYESDSIIPSLVRAIAWKSNLVKMLNKYDKFENPSFNLDKRFSLAAARHIMLDTEDKNEIYARIPRTSTSRKPRKEEINDHEADAICLAALPLFEREVKKLQVAVKPTQQIL